MEEETCSARCVLMISPLVKTEKTHSECIPLINDWANTQMETILRNG